MNEPTCADKVDRACRNRLDDIRCLFDPSPSMVELSDDGTLDTVLMVGDNEFRYSDTSEYRENGTFDLDEFLTDNWTEIQGELYDRFNEYGLSFDYVPSDTFEDQDRGYFRYQISYGGPSEEFRFYYCDENLYPYDIEFWYLDWFDGASHTLTGNDKALMNSVFDWFKECGSVSNPPDPANIHISTG